MIQTPEEREPPTVRRFVLALELDSPTQDSEQHQHPLCFTDGTRVDPLIIGRCGTFRIEGDQVLDVHAHICFNGRIVFMCSADPNHPVLVDGAPLPNVWTELAPTRRLQFGSVVAMLHFRDLLQDQLARTQKPELPRSPSALPPRTPRFARRSPRDSEMTRIAFVRTELDMAAVAPPMQVEIEVDVDVEPTAPTALLPATTASAPSSVTEPRAAIVPPPRRSQRRWVRLFAAVGGVTLLAMAGVFFSHVHKQEQHHQPSSASSSSSYSPNNKVDDEPIDTTAPGVIMHPATTKATIDAGSARSRSSADAGASLERAAADAVRRGDLRAATEMYERLATEQPENPAFARTAQLLRKRMESSAPAP